MSAHPTNVVPLTLAIPANRLQLDRALHGVRLHAGVASSAGGVALCVLPDLYRHIIHSPTLGGNRSPKFGRVRGILAPVDRSVRKAGSHGKVGVGPVCGVSDVRSKLKCPLFVAHDLSGF